MKFDPEFQKIERKVDKRKHHRRGFSDDVQDKRHQRINFKKYIQQVEESELDLGDDIDESL